MDQDKKDKTKESISEVQENPEEYILESEPAAEQKEAISEEEKINQELKREINLMELDEGLKQEAQIKAKKIQILGDDEKLKHLLDIARAKGVIFAIKVAKEMNDPYLLDTFHDMLVKEGLYKDFIK